MILKRSLINADFVIIFELLYASDHFSYQCSLNDLQSSVSQYEMTEHWSLLTHMPPKIESLRPLMWLVMSSESPGDLVTRLDLTSAAGTANENEENISKMIGEKS